ncbi:hypothetical protein DKX38_010037 [Salix brachista]|uniref:Uncharacterized protein n=1 Tax=Salix brachista TaxID=2182728 RepID=A0A5N5MF29_9ROSI|nr:hypothetical protein DKX38_010037 [Salix brachista]
MNSRSDEIEYNITQIEQCTAIPPFINSPGVFQDDLLEAPLPSWLELLVLAIFFISHVFRFILKRFSIPLLVSQILTILQAAIRFDDNESRFLRADDIEIETEKMLDLQVLRSLAILYNLSK